MLNRAPGVHIHRGSGQEHLTAIRSPVLVGGAGAGSFLYLEDGIPMRAAGFALKPGCGNGVRQGACARSRGALGKKLPRQRASKCSSNAAVIKKNNVSGRFPEGSRKISRKTEFQ